LRAILYYLAIWKRANWRGHERKKPVASEETRRKLKESLQRIENLPFNKKDSKDEKKQKE